MMKENVKDTMKLGIASQVGSFTLGSMAKVPGMPATGVPGIANTGFTMMNVGQLGKTGMSVAKMMGKK